MNNPGKFHTVRDGYNIQTNSNSKQDHKFFERYLNNDLNILSKELQDRYFMIKNLEVPGVTPVGQNDFWVQSQSVSTIKWREYNVFQFNIPEIYNLYIAVRDMVKEACEYYEIDFEKSQFMLQGWFNINESNGGKLDWHEHGDSGAPNFHGYYCVNAEPSSTHYYVFGKDIENINKNNRAILSEMGHPHAMGNWSWNGPRITVAYDVIPLKDIQKVGYSAEQHWIPLC